MPIAFGIVRALQCVAFGGASVVVLASTAALIFALSGFRPGGRILSRRSPSTPASAKRRCQRHTVGLAIPTYRAIAFTALPFAVASTIRARRTIFAGVLRSAPAARAMRDRQPKP